MWKADCSLALSDETRLTHPCAAALTACALLLTLLTSGCRAEKPAQSGSNRTAPGANTTAPERSGPPVAPPTREGPEPLLEGDEPGRNEPDRDEPDRDEPDRDEPDRDEPGQVELPPVERPPPPRLKRVDDSDEARNDPDIALFLSERLEMVDRVTTFRVRAEAGDYFNCHYKGQAGSYYHLRLRGDGSAHLDGYLPRGPDADQLWLEIQKQSPHPLTVKVVLRASTVSSVCAAQVEIVEFERGWNYHGGALAVPGARARFLANQKDTEPPRNSPPLDELMKLRRHFVDRTVRLRVRARLDRYYQCRYADAERTHYALFLQGDGFKGLRAYVPRDAEGRELVRRLARDEGARLTVLVTIASGRYDELCSDQVELVETQWGWAPAPR